MSDKPNDWDHDVDANMVDQVVSNDNLDTDVDAELDGTTSNGILEDDQGAVPPTLSRSRGGSGFGRRVGGLLATLLGLIGMLASLVAAFLTLQVFFGAGDAADRLIEPISGSVDRLETRVDQADELVTGQGVDAADVDQLNARADGLVDLVDGARRSFGAIAEHPVYRWLPIELDPLDTTLTEVETSVQTVVDGAGSAGRGNRVAPDDAEKMRSQLNDLQAGFGDMRSTVAETLDSLTRWIRLGGLAGFLASIWSLWAQSWLLRRGWRGLRGQTP